MSQPAHRSRASERPSISLVARMAVAFGHPAHLIGWLVFGASMIAWWTFGSQSEYITIFRFLAPTETTSGKIVEITETGMSEGGSDDTPGTPIFRIRYQYFEPSGEPLLATGHMLGQKFKLSQIVQVEYLQSNPRQARVVGGRIRSFGPWAGLVGLIPIGALTTMLYGLRLGWRNAALATRGRVTLGRLVHKEPTNTTINNRRVFKLTFEFIDANDNSQRTEVRTHFPEKLEDDAEEWIIYDPSNSERAFALDAMPGGVRFDSAGNYTGVSLQRLALVLLLPPICLLPHVLVVIVKLG